MNKLLFALMFFMIPIQSNAGPLKKCWCHGMVPISGTEYNCQEYRCPCEGSNGKCPKVDPTGKAVKKTESIPAKGNESAR